MDYVKPYGVVDSMLAGGALKLSLPPRQLVLRGMLAGAYLGIGTSMAVTVAVETGYWILGSLVFPFGLALAILLGAEIIAELERSARAGRGRWYGTVAGGPSSVRPGCTAASFTSSST